jgi:hypothetical protein
MQRRKIDIRGHYFNGADGCILYICATYPIYDRPNYQAQLPGREKNTSQSSAGVIYLETHPCIVTQALEQRIAHRPSPIAAAGVLTPGWVSSESLAKHTALSPSIFAVEP